MRSYSSLLLISLLLAIGAGMAVPVSAQTDRERSEENSENSRESVTRPAVLPPRPRALSESVRKVQRETGGQVLGAESVPFNGGSINRVKIIDKGGRVRYMDDAPPPRPTNERRREVGDREETPRR